MRVFPVTLRRWRSRSAISENPMWHANVAALSSMERELLPMKFYIAGIRNFTCFCCCHFDLNPMTFIHELDSYPLKISPQTKNKLSTSRLFEKLSYYIYIQTDATGGNKSSAVAEMAAQCCVCHLLLVKNADIDGYMLSRIISKLSCSISEIFAFEWGTSL